MTIELNLDELAFVELIRACPGQKLNGGEAYDTNGVPLWRIPEALGLIECTGSYKWKPAEPVPPVVSERDPWPMLSSIHLEAIVFAYNEGYSKAYDKRVFPNPFAESGSQAAAWTKGTRDGTENRKRDDETLVRMRIDAKATGIIKK
jgi:hypothetical protein